MEARARDMERIPEFIGNHPFLVSLFIAILILLLWNIFGSAISGISQASPSDATYLMNREKALLIDVRPETEFSAGHVLNAINIPAAEMESRLQGLEKHKGGPVITCCQNGSASGRIARTLRMNGFEKVYCLKGGITAWQNAGLPISRNTDAGAAQA
ncbi:MAG: rhodanese-like domain-containing protein [Gammaproteobacteria bacterium]